MKIKLIIKNFFLNEIVELLFKLKKNIIKEVRLAGQPELFKIPGVADCKGFELPSHFLFF